MLLFMGAHSYTHTRIYDIIYVCMCAYKLNILLQKQLIIMIISKSNLQN